MTTQQRNRLLIALAVIGGLIGVRFYVTRHEQPNSVVVTPTQPTPPALVAREAPPTTPAKAPKPKLGPGEMEVCGRGIVTEAQAQDKGLEAAYLATMQEAFEKVRKRLLASSVERERMTGLLLESMRISANETEAAFGAESEQCYAKGNSRPPVKNPACWQAQAVTEASWQRVAERIAPLVMQMADIATHTQDPAVYALALSKCTDIRTAFRPASCMGVTALGWARMQPNNLIPWLYALQDAQERKDSSGAAEALYRASIATRADEQPGWATVTVMNAVDPANELELAASYMPSLALPTSIAFAPYGSVAKDCSSPAIQDSNRRQVCEKIADTLLNRSDTAIAQRIGVGMSERLGWDAAKAKALRDESQALINALWWDYHLNTGTEEGWMSCSFVREARRRWRLQSEMGELQSARHLVQASGKTVQQVTQDYVKRQQQKKIEPPVSAAPR